MMNLPLPNNRIPGLSRNSSPTNKPANAAAKPVSNQLKQLPLQEFLQPMVAAMNQAQPWVEDFGSDQIMLPVDLYEVIKEFARLQKQANQ